MAAQVAGIVIGDLHLKLFGKLSSSLLDQPVDLAEQFVRLTLFGLFFFRREFFVCKFKIYIVTDLFMVLEYHIPH